MPRGTRCRDSQKYAPCWCSKCRQNGFVYKSKCFQEPPAFQKSFSSGPVMGSASIQFCLYLITLKKFIVFQLRNASLGSGWGVERELLDPQRCPSTIQNQDQGLIEDQGLVFRCYLLVSCPPLPIHIRRPDEQDKGFHFCAYHSSLKAGHSNIN